MKVDQFDFALPRSCIASRPAKPRDSARLLLFDNTLADYRVSDLPRLLNPGDLLVFNQTQVIPARLRGVLINDRHTPVEVTLLREDEENHWAVFAKPGRKLKVGQEIEFAEKFNARVLKRVEGGEIYLEFNVDNTELRKALNIHGVIPLPPYIPRANGADEQDKEDYQTIFASQEGAVASPTAGLHFTKQLFKKLDERGINRTFITLHIGAGTFLPVKSQDTDNHNMHAEWGKIDYTAASVVNRTRARGGKIIAVGTTSLRLLETAATEEGRARPFEGETSLFITPGYRFKLVDRLLTNFHLPRSTLFMLVSAFSTLSQVRMAYEHAKREGYRFYSYGDACLITRIDS